MSVASIRRDTASSPLGQGTVRMLTELGAFETALASVACEIAELRIRVGDCYYAVSRFNAKFPAAMSEISSVGGGMSYGLPNPNVLPPQVIKGLSDRIYDKRKVAALEIERMIREASQSASADPKRVNQILSALINDFAYSVIPNSRNGGLIALAAAAIALGANRIQPYLELIVPPVLACFHDPDSRVRYYACESMYNVAKVARDHILKFFNEIFDALSKLAADNESSVKNGAELLDRLIKDIVSERATHYAAGEGNPELSSMGGDDSKSTYRSPSPANSTRSTTAPSAQMSNAGTTLSPPGMDATHPVHPSDPSFPPAPGSTPLLPHMKPTTFNLPRFIPLLAERIHTLNPYTRMFLVQWISVLDSVPDLELIGHVPDFLDGLFHYLSDPNVDVRVATLNVLGEFLKEIRDVVELQRERGGGALNVKGRKGWGFDGDGVVFDAGAWNARRGSAGGDQQDQQAMAPPPAYAEREREEAAAGGKDADSVSTSGPGVEGTVTGTGVTAELQPEAALREPGLDGALSALSLNGAGAAGAPSITVARPASTVPTQPNADSLPYVPGQGVVLDIGRMVDILSPHLTSTDEETQATALRWVNEFILLVREVMLPFTPLLLSAVLPGISHPVTLIREIAVETNGNLYRLILETSLAGGSSGGSGNGEAVVTPGGGSLSASVSSLGSTSPGNTTTVIAFVDPFELKATVDTVIYQFQDENEETRVAAMEWLLMLHRKSPKKFMSSDEATFSTLLQTLSDTSEDVVKRDLQLLAQISQHSDDEYFMRFMMNLLHLFSNDRRLLESRGALIIRQLCLSLNPEKMYRAFAEILERDEDLDFASIMVQNLNIILITAPELSDLRRRLKNLETRDGLILFAALYRSWCHNPVAAFSLCLLAQAYEHAANLLQVFADLEITVTLLIQIDKLVQLLE
ncbi:hypothetical protein HK101_009298, partial [Irineochytrium annulatum]